MIVITDKVTCCGCWACENICPKHCVVMKEDNEGFRYPEVDVEVCIECGLCEAVCPILHKPIKEHEETIGYVIQHKDNNIRRDSTSGGFFSAISDYVLNQNGYVFGAIYNKKMEVVHYGTNKKEEIQLFRGSKYVQSKIGHTYQEAKKLLQTGCLVCFSGTPCQIAGLKNYLKKDYANLITVDLVCHGNPSPLLFRKYLEYQQIKYKNKVTGVKFRDKYYGYNYSTMTLDFLEWYKDKLVFLLDGNLCYQFDKKEGEAWPFDKPYYLILNVAYGGWGGSCGMDDSAFPCEMKVDWIRYYKLKE